MKKRIISLLLVLVMVLGMLPAAALAAEEADYAEEKTVEAMVNAMPLRDKVTQMLMVDFRKWGSTASTAKDFTKMNDEVRKIVEDYNFGAVLFFANNIQETEQSYQLSMDFQTAATKDGGIPLIICADQEGGSVYRLGSGTALPGNMALGATYTANGTKYAREAGQIIGSELSVLGINTDLAPVVDVNNNANNPVIGLRSYSDDATIVGEMAAEVIAGMAEYNVVGCAKHFPGHGDTGVDSHYGLPVVDKSLEELMQNELMPYTVAIEQGIEMIMTAHILYPQLEQDTIVSNKTGKAESLPATMSDDILTELLKGDMGFDGIIATDSMTMAGVAANWDPVQAAVIAVSAGVDMLCMPSHQYCMAQMDGLDAVIEGLIEAVEDGTIPMSRIDDAVTRILTVKENRGILDFDPADYSLEQALATVGSAQNRAMEREMSAAAITVMKNKDNVLPLKLSSASKVLMVVPYENERAQMIMGWNRAKEAGLIPAGAEVQYVCYDKNSTISSLSDKLVWADTYIINSEVSAASQMAYNSWVSKMPNTICNYAAANGKTAIVASVDKPYDVQLYPNASAIVAGYGCKGSSVDPTEALIGGATGAAKAYGPNIIAAVEVIFGVFEAQGTLPVDVPVFNASSRSYTDTILYPRGYGLTYSDMATVSFVSNGVVVDTQQVVMGDCAVAPEAPVMEQYVFTGWYTDDGQLYDFAAPVTGDLTLTAQWEVQSQGPTVFDDVAEDAYYYDAVLWAVDQDITTGTSATTFSPDRTCTRAQAVTFLWRAAGEPEPAIDAAEFTDIEEGSYYYKAVLWAVEQGITTGTTATTFGPSKPCTRAQVVTFLYRSQGSPATTGSNSFTDVPAGQYYYDPVLWAVANGVTTGTSATAFSPDKTCTRAQIVTFLYRAMAD